jgi:hypothetical protein
MIAQLHASLQRALSALGYAPPELPPELEPEWAPSALGSAIGAAGRGGQLPRLTDGRSGEPAARIPGRVPGSPVADLAQP